jgi:hypothetical protein
MKISATLTRGLTDEQVAELAREIKHSLLAKVLREFLQKEIELSYRAEENVTTDHDNLPFYLKEVGERRGYRQVLKLILEE